MEENPGFVPTNLPSLDQESDNEENESSTRDIAVQAFWDYIIKVANGNKLNRMVLWHLVEQYPQGNYDYNGRVIDNNSKPVPGDFAEPEPGSGGEK